MENETKTINMEFMHRMQQYSAVPWPAELEWYFARQAQVVHVTEENVGEVTKLIDPIAKELVGGLLVKRLLQLSPHCTRHGIAIACGVDTVELRTEEEALALIKEKSVPYHRVKEHTFQVLEQLRLTSGLYERVDQRPADACYCGAFLVEKKSQSGTVKMRVIVDARYANAWIDSSTFGFNLFSVEFLIKKISSLQQAPWFALNCDLRHWFHQIGLHESLRDFFVFEEDVRDAPRFLRAKTVPMGFVGGPYIAQCCSWALLLFSDNAGGPMSRPESLGLDPELLEALRSADQPPSVVPLSCGGCIIVLIDNLLIVSTNRSIISAWKSRLARAQREFKVVFKSSTEDPDGPPPDYVEVTPGSKVSIEFSGINLAHDRRWITVDADQSLPFLDDRDVWRGTHLNLANVMGVLGWHNRVWAMPLVEERMCRFRKIWKFVTPPVTASWKSMVAVPRDAVADIWFYWEHRSKQCWDVACMYKFVPEPENWNFFCAAVDATLLRTGIAQFSRDLRHLQFVGNAFHTFNKIIAVGELLAISRAIEWAVKRRQEYNILVIATDNLVAKRQLEKQVADSDDANELLRHIFQIMQDNNLYISLCYVKSEDNAADPVSRDKWVDDADMKRRVAATAALLGLEQSSWLVQHVGSTRRTSQRHSQVAPEDARSRARHRAQVEEEE